MRNKVSKVGCFSGVCVCSLWSETQFQRSDRPHKPSSNLHFIPFVIAHLSHNYLIPAMSARNQPQVFDKLGSPSESRATCLCMERGTSACTVEASELLLLLQNQISKLNIHHHNPQLLLFCTWSLMMMMKPSSLFYFHSPPPPTHLRLLIASASFCSSSSSSSCTGLMPPLQPPPLQAHSITSLCSTSPRKTVKEGVMTLWRGLGNRPFLELWTEEKLRQEQQIGECVVDTRYQSEKISSVSLEGLPHAIIDITFFFFYEIKLM